MVGVLFTVFIAILSLVYFRTVTPMTAGVVALTLLGTGLLARLGTGLLAPQTAAEVQKAHLLMLTLENMSQGLCVFDTSQRIIISNERYRAIYSLPEELVKPGTTLHQILDYRIVNGGYRGSPEEYLNSQDATEIQQLGNGRIVEVLRRKIEDGGWLTIHEDITERRQNEGRISFLAHHDPLTGLANREAFIEKIADWCTRYRRWGEEFNVLLLDLDRFKQINDAFGHPAGDVLLTQVADRLRSSVRETDVLARLGGDEFAIIQAAQSNPRDSAQTLANRIIELLDEPFSVDGNDVTVSASIGITLAPEHGVIGDDLLKMADLALHHTKSQGRNGCTFFRSALSEAAVARQLLESELRRAIAQNEFELHYQPFVDAETWAICGAEALVRWRHPQNGLISPDRFIPAAEESGLISQIGEWVLRSACAEAASWPTPTKVAINLSAVQFRNSNLLDVVTHALTESGLPPQRLELEITETALVEYGSECLSMLGQLKSLGISIALDDFGTGYSSLSQLTVFPFDKIKIDKSFTQNMTKRADCAAIISAVLALAQSLNITTTAEGVETKEELRLLTMAGVSIVQGYLIKRAGPASELDFHTLSIRPVAENVA